MTVYGINGIYKRVDKHPKNIRADGPVPRLFHTALLTQEGMCSYSAAIIHLRVHQHPRSFRRALSAHPACGATTCTVVAHAAAALPLAGEQAAAPASPAAAIPT